MCKCISMYFPFSLLHIVHSYEQCVFYYPKMIISVHLADLEKMSSLERITFLQEKLQDIRNHYLSLKSEVASIDRRRKRIKKKERESESALYDLRNALDQYGISPAVFKCVQSESKCRTWLGLNVRTTGAACSMLSPPTFLKP